MTTIEINGILTNFKPEIMKKEIELYHKGQLFSAIDDAIKYLRILKKEKGLKVLTELLTQGAIKKDLYLKMRQAIENPETPYVITITK